MFKTAYGERSRKSFSTSGESLTKQSFKKECDINNIMNKYQKTGLVQHVSRYGGDYIDLGEPLDYQHSLNVVIQAQEAFDSLPSSVRKRFSNDPAEFLTFVSDPANEDDMRSLGLLPAVSEPEPVVPAPEPEPSA